jgi:ribonuclease BN (tRNA processing enzyme)
MPIIEINLKLFHNITQIEEFMKIVKLNGKKLPLTNNGELSLFFVGIGSAFTKTLYQTNLLVVKGKDHLLVDCGTKCSQALYELGLDITEIENFLITHSHADHVGSLEEVSLTGRYLVKKKPTMIITEAYQQILWDKSLRGGCGFSDPKTGKEASFGDYWNIIRPKWLPGYPRETWEANLGNINLKIFRTKHVPDNARNWDTSFWSSGIIIDNRILFSADTLFDPDLIDSYEKLFPIEVIFHDCQFFKGGVHASLEELKNLPCSIKAKMILTHYGDDWKKFEKKVKEYGFAGLGKQQVFYQF